MKKLSSRVQSMKPSATLGMAQAARDLSDAGIDVVVLSAGEPDFDTPKSICEVAKESIDLGKTHYAPVRGTKNMIQAMQAKFLRDQGVSYSADEVMCTSGAKSAILMSLEAVINDGDEVIIFSPYWVSYIEHIRMVRGVPVIVECQALDNFMPKAVNLKKAITNKTKAVILNSPNNPSGGVISYEQLKELCEVLKDTNIWLISDEIYEKLLFGDAKHYSPAAISNDMRDRTIVISGASKGYAMTGWRVGVVAANKEIIAGLNKLQGQQVTCIPEFIQDASAYALSENDLIKSEIANMCIAYKERRDLGIGLFEQWPHVKVFKPQGAFYLWVDFSYYIGKIIGKNKIKDDIELATLMLKEAHVASVPGTPFGTHGYIRFSIASSTDDIKRAFIRVKEWLVGE
jgi:aspartate aminotransferase